MPDPHSESTALAITWDDVLEPGFAVSPDHPDPFAGLQPAVPRTPEFSLINACFLAAQSHLVYRSYLDSKENPTLSGRHAILERLGFEESFCGEFAGTVCSILEPLKSDLNPAPATVVFRGSCNVKNFGNEAYMIANCPIDTLTQALVRNSNMNVPMSK